jgi:hypothetical protein
MGIDLRCPYHVNVAIVHSFLPVRNDCGTNPQKRCLGLGFSFISSYIACLLTGITLFVLSSKLNRNLQGGVGSLGCC